MVQESKVCKRIMISGRDCPTAFQNGGNFVALIEEGVIEACERHAGSEACSAYDM